MIYKQGNLFQPYDTARSVRSDRLYKTCCCSCEYSHYGSLQGSGFTQVLVQAIARDYLVAVMLRLESRKYPVVAHTPGEIILEVPLETAVKDIQRVVDMPVEWAPELNTTNKIRIHDKYYTKGED